MDGHLPAQQQPKKPMILNLLKQKHRNEPQPVTKSPTEPQQTVNVDQLAREKVQEIESALDKLTSLKQDLLNTWFSTLKQIITAADLHRTNDGKNADDNEQPNKQETGDCIYADYVDDHEQLGTSIDLSEQFATNSVKWTIRVHAFKIVHRLMSLLSNGSNKPLPPVLVKLLPDLVRLAFVAATSPYDELKMQGFEMFRFLIENFAGMEEKEFPGHSILEQYKTQVLSAVKPAFNLDAPPYTTAIASQICSLWICHGLEKESIDVQRTYKLMLSSIEKLDGQGVNQHSKLYTESELEQERVDILGSWAQLVIASIESKLSTKHPCRMFRLSEDESANLESLIETQVTNLVDKWWEALKDYALLIMPSPKLMGVLHDNEHVYTREVALKLFEPVWPKIVLAQTYLLIMKSSPLEPAESKYVQFIWGLIFRELSRSSLARKGTKNNASLPEPSFLALKSLFLLVSNSRTQAVFQSNLAVTREFYLVLHHMSVSYDQSVRSTIKSLLDTLFAIIFDTIIHEESCVHYSIAKLISLLMKTMKDIKLASKQEAHADLDSSKAHLVLRMRNLMSILRKSPKATLAETPLQEALIAVFQEMLRFDEDKSVNLSLIDQLQHLYPLMVEPDRNHMIKHLHPEFESCIEKLVMSIVVSMRDCNHLDKSKLAQLDVFFEASRDMIRNSDSENRIKLMNSYVELSNTAVEKLGYKKDQLVESKPKRELVDYFIQQPSLVEREFMDHFKCDPLSKEVLHRYHNTIKLWEDVKNELLDKNEKVLEAKKASGLKSNLAKPRAAKITLKADFSNFYAPKKT